MNFHDLTRSELQFLCKKNHISAKMTNLAMANTLSSLQIVEGLEEFLNLSDATPKRRKRSTPVVTRSTNLAHKVLTVTPSVLAELASVQLKEIKEVEDEKNEESSSTQAEQIRSLQSQLNSANEKLKMADVFAANVMVELEKRDAIIHELQDRLARAEQLPSLQSQLNSANEKLKMGDVFAANVMVELENRDAIIHELQDRLARGEALRKKLHNTILELKGNIRVFCRVRPPMLDDSAGGVIAYPTSTKALGRGIELSQSGGKKYSFTFDKVFSHDASQESVFVEVSQLVQSALDGYKVCIFAYGQTGSGKTYTMMGKPDAPEHKGLIPRSMEQIFQTSQALVGQGWKFKLQASMLEIYNEKIRDLLVPNKASGLEISRLDNETQYTITHDANGNTYVSDLTKVDVCNTKEISLLFEQAAQSRSVGKTNMNEQSSRSHFVFTLRIYGVNENAEQQVQGVLNLIDLAGNERLSKSGVTGDRLKETQAINSSLSSLSSVILALANKGGHVPFRDSKLTYLLQPCLGGDSKTLMFVNISPDRSSVGETLCSLRFAKTVNAVSRPQKAVRRQTRSSLNKA